MPGKVSHRKVGAALAETQAFTEQAVKPAINQLLHNDRVTQGKLATLEAFHQMSFRQRLRWLFRGVR